MIAVPDAAEPKNDVDRVLQDLAASDGVQFRVDAGDGLFIVWLKGGGAPQYGCHADTWWTAGTDGWHLMAQFGAVKCVRFVQVPDPHSPERETLSIRFVGPNGSSTLRADFTRLYDDQGQPLDAPFARWKELRAKYGDQDEVSVENGNLLSAAVVGSPRGEVEGFAARRQR